MTDFNLFDTPVLHPKDLSTGAIVYYADHHAFSNEYLHGLQVSKVTVSADKYVLLDNGRKFNPETGLEITKGNGGVLYPYNPTTRAMVQDAQAKLFLVNEVVSISFDRLTVQQLSMILDVARGAFTQVTALTPCGGGCGDTVQVAGIDIEVNTTSSDLDKVTESMRNRPLPVDIAPIDVTAPIAFTDASYEPTESELDDIEDADEDDEYHPEDNPLI